VADSSRRFEQSFALAKEAYAELGVDVDGALSRLTEISISLHCWQGDDVRKSLRESFLCCRLQGSKGSCFFSCILIDRRLGCLTRH
jgi:hypothetical protein